MVSICLRNYCPWKTLTLPFVIPSAAEPDLAVRPGLARNSQLP